MNSLIDRNASGFPFFTIITATRNAAAVLPRLLESLASQTCRNFELIIQDGASTDGTVTVAEAWRERLPALSITSEPDTGIYDAWNKVLPRIRGQWVLFLGADDVLADTIVLEGVREKLAVLPSEALFACGNVRFFDASGLSAVIHEPLRSGAIEMLRQGIMPGVHTAMFHKAALFQLHCFDISFRILGDYDFLCRFLTAESQLFRLGITVTHKGSGGISDNLFSMLATRRELLVAVRRHFPAHLSFALHVVPVVKGYILQGLGMILGRRYAPHVLDAVRRIRGLPPVWEKKTKKRV